MASGETAVRTTRPDRGPGALYRFLEQGTDVLEPHETRSSGGIYGIGMKIDMSPPFAVQSLNDVKDRNGGRIDSDRLPIGDNLVAVDGQSLTQAKTSNFVKDLIWGEGRTTTVLTFRSKASGRQYDVEVLRHIAIKSWDTHRQWLTLKEEFSGRTLSADPQIVETLERIRAVLCGTDGYAKDMMRYDEGMTTRLGLKFYLEMAGKHPRPCAIAAITPGGPAAISGQLKVDDEILEVDGVAAREINLTKLVGGSDVVGSRCVLKVRRGLSTFETSIVRTAEDRMVKVSAEQTMLGELLKAVHGTHAEEKVREVMRQAEALEGSRLKHEAELAVKLWDAQAAVVEMVQEAERMLHVGDGNVEGLEELAEKLRACERESEGLMREGSDLRAQLDASEAHCRELEEELAASRARGDGMVAKSRFDAQQAERDRLLRQVETLRAQQAGLVSLERASSAERHSKEAQDEAAHLREQMRGMVARSVLEGEQQDNARLRAEIERLRAALAESCPQADYKAARDTIETLKAELERARKARDGFVPAEELEALCAELEAARQHLGRLRQDKATMVPKAELEWAREENGALQIGIETLRVRAEELSAELDALRLAGRDTVPRADLAACQAELRAAQAQLAQRTEDARAAEKLVEELRRKLAAQAQELRVLMDEREGLVSKKELREAQAEATRLRADSDTLRRELAGVDHQLDECRKENAALRGREQDALQRLEAVAPRAELLAARADLAARTEDLAASKAAEEAAEQRAHSIAAAASELRDEIERLKELLAETVPRAELRAAESHAAAAGDEAVALRKEVKVLEELLTEGTAAALALREELEALKSAGADVVPRPELLEALDARAGETRRAERSEAAGKQAAEELREEREAGAALRTELAGLKAQMEGMAPAADLRVARGDAARAREECVGLHETMKQLRRERESLAEEVRRLRDLVAQLEGEARVMVPRPELEAAQRAAADCKAEAAEARIAQDAAQQSAALLEKQLAAARKDLDAARETLLESVARDALLDAQKQNKSAQVRVSEMEGAVVVANSTAHAVQDKLNAARQTIEALQRELAGQVPRESLLAAQKEAKDALARAAEADRAREALGGEQKALLARLRDQTQALQEARAAVEGMVARDVLAAAEAAARAAEVDASEARGRAEALEARAAELRERLKGQVGADELSRARAEAQRAGDELRALRRALAEAGLGEEETRARLLAALKGPPLEPFCESAPHHVADARAVAALVDAARAAALPLEGLSDVARAMPAVPVLPAELCALLRALAGPPARSVAEARRILDLVAAAPAMSAREVERLRNALAGPPALTVAELEEMLALAPTLADLRRVLERSSTLEHQFADLAQRAAELQAELRELRARLCPAPEEHAAYRALKDRMSALLRPQPPFFAPGGGEFAGHLALLLLAKDGHTIFYTLDGTEPSADNYAACGPSPLTIDLLADARVTACCIDDKGDASAAQTHAYTYTGAAPAHGQQEAGLGMLLERVSGAQETTVKGLVDGGAADLDGRIQPGDVLLRLAGRNVAGLSLRGIETLCAGNVGSSVELVLRRAPTNVRAGLEQDEERVFRAQMLRTYTPNLASHKMHVADSSLSAQLHAARQPFTSFVASRVQHTPPPAGTGARPSPGGTPESRVTPKQLTAV